MYAGCLSLSLKFHGLLTCLSLSPMVAGCLSLSLAVPWTCYMSLTVSHCCWLSLTVSMELLHVSQGLPWMLDVSHCLSGPIKLPHYSHCFWLSITVSQLHGVATCLSLSPMVTGCLSLSVLSHRVATCLSLSPIVAGLLSLSLLAPSSCYVSLTVSHCC